MSYYSGRNAPFYGFNKTYSPSSFNKGENNGGSKQILTEYSKSEGIYYPSKKSNIKKMKKEKY